MAFAKSESQLEDTGVAERVSFRRNWRWHEETGHESTQDGQTISMFMDTATRVTRDKKKISAAELRTGLHVVVDAHGDSMDDLDVVEVRIVRVPAKK